MLSLTRMLESSGVKQYLEQKTSSLLFLLFLFVLLAMPFRVLMHGYIPPDDGLRHVAKVVSGKDWPQVLVMNETFAGQDHNEGWHLMLGALHTAGLEKSALLEFSIISLVLLFVLAGLFLFRDAPEAWGISLLLMNMSHVMTRFFLGRPLVFTCAVLLVQLGLWGSKARVTPRRFVLSTALFFAACYIHGSYYLWCLLPVSICLAGRIRSAILSAASWLLGAFLAGCATGDPLTFLFLQVKLGLIATGSSTSLDQLVVEFQPYYNMYSLLFVLVLCLALAYKNKLNGWVTSPAFWLMVLGFILGMKNGRFWHDWGRVAMCYWVAESLTALLRDVPKAMQSQRLLAGGLVAVALWLSVTTDMAGRWSKSAGSDYLSLNDPTQKGWLPDDGGIFYSIEMGLFYRTFYENPEGNWRYLLGYEPILMPAEDLALYREIQKFQPKPPDHLFQPWVENMTAADRLFMQRGPYLKPDLPDLEWKYVAQNTWAGRLPRHKAVTEDHPL